MGLLCASCEKNAELKIEKIEPAVGPASGGHVTIHGSGFQSQGPVGATVYFGTSKGRVNQIKSDEISVRAPGGEAGSKVDVRVVFDNGREFVVKGAFEYRKDGDPALTVDALTEK
jgi:hypothetical protein